MRTIAIAIYIYASGRSGGGVGETTPGCEAAKHSGRKKTQGADWMMRSAAGTGLGQGGRDRGDGQGGGKGRMERRGGGPEASATTVNTRLTHG